jgi:CHU_C Type IX secretion signal domain
MSKRKFLIVFLLLSPLTSFGQFTDSCTVYATNIITVDCCGSNCHNLTLISDCEIEDFHLTIYNRWGEIIFETKDSNEAWDPLDNSKIQIIKDGVYIWQLEGIKTADFDMDGDEEKGPFLMRGQVTVLR